MLFVLKKYHYNGIATSLVLNMIDDCKENNKRHIKIPTNNMNNFLLFFISTPLLFFSF